MEWRCILGWFTGIDIISPRPCRRRMDVDLIEIPLTVDIGPGIDLPAHGRRGLAMLGENAPRCLVPELPHVSNETLPGFAAELKLTDVRVPSAAIRFADSGIFGVMGQNPLAQRR